MNRDTALKMGSVVIAALGLLWSVTATTKAAVTAALEKKADVVIVSAVQDAVGGKADTARVGELRRDFEKYVRDSASLHPDPEQIALLVKSVTDMTVAMEGVSERLDRTIRNYDRMDTSLRIILRDQGYPAGGGGR